MGPHTGGHPLAEVRQGRFAGKVALVTGAARGQGRSHAVRLSQEGADVIVVDACTKIASATYEFPGIEALHETASLVEAAGGRVVARQTDVRDLAGLQDAVDDGVRQLGGLDIVLANAAIYGTGLSWELSEDEWQDMLAINLGGVWRTVKAAMPAMLRTGRGGSIGITSSVAGLRAQERSAHYVSSKHGLVGLCRTLATELAPHDIRVNTVHPATTNTGMAHHQDRYDAAVGRTNATEADFAATTAATHLLGVPWMEPSEITSVLLWLASDEAKHLTGVSLPVDAGATIKPW